AITFPDRLVAFAGSFLEPLPVGNRDRSPRACDQSGTLQKARSLGDGGARRAQHLGEKIMRKVDLSRTGAVMVSQQPASHPSLDGVQAIAGGRVRNLNHECLHVTQRMSAQFGAMVKSIF